MGFGQFGTTSYWTGNVESALFAGNGGEPGILTRPCPWTAVSFPAISHPARNASVRPVSNTAFVRIDVLSERAGSPGKA